MNWNLMVCFHKIYRGGFLPSKLCKVGIIPSGILVGDRPSIQSTIVATGSLAIFFLGDKVEGQSPGAIEMLSDAVSEHFLELGFCGLFYATLKISVLNVTPSRWLLFQRTHSSSWDLKLFMTFRSISTGIAATSSWIRCFKSAIVLGLISNTSFQVPRKKIGRG